jgi:formate hydrogenlyase subunit 3/multisubunit Na+/H+ antiporter MnhD subunit
MTGGPIDAGPALAGWGLGLPAWVLVLVPAWPLALAALALVPPLRGTALRLAPWSALPALLLAVLGPAAGQPLPGLLLGASLALDAAGRWLLGAVALLWLACGRLAAGRLRQSRRLLAFLLAMTGALWLPLAADLPSMLAASVLAAYPLYGWLGGARGARVLLASVVVADLLILEAVLLLAKGAAGLDIGALRTALAEAPGGGIVLALLVIGFGVKAGLMGLHYWLAPTLTEARGSRSGAVAAFVLAAGLLPWLRLLPLGSVHWPAAAELLPWLALAGCGWAVVAGALQAAPRATVAYTLSGLASFWLGLLGLGLDAPVAPPPMAGLLPAALAVSALGTAALLLAGGAVHRHGGLAGWGLALLAAMLVALAVLGAAVPAVAGGDTVPWALTGSLVCVGILLGASATAAAARADQTGPESQTRWGAGLVAAGILMAVLTVRPLSDAMASAGIGSGNRLIASSAALFGGFVVGLVAPSACARLPRVPPGDLLVVIERVAAAGGAAWNRFGTAVGHCCGRLPVVVGRARPRAARPAVIDRTEALLRRWSTATLLLLAAGAAMALLARLG